MVENVPRTSPGGDQRLWGWKVVTAVGLSDADQKPPGVKKRQAGVGFRRETPGPRTSPRTGPLSRQKRDYAEYVSGGTSVVRGLVGLVTWPLLECGGKWTDVKEMVQELITGRRNVVDC